MTEQVERLIERLTCEASENMPSINFEAAAMIKRLSAEKAALEAKLALWSGLPTGFSAQLEALDSAYARARALEAQLAEARGALEPFANCCEHITDDEDDEEWAKFRLLIKDYRRARAALTAEQGDE